MYQIIKTNKFSKSYRRVDEKYLNFISKTLARLFLWPPFEKEHNVHSLNWKYEKYLSINVTWDYRIIFNIDKKENIIYLYDIWTHSQLYK